MSGHVRTSQGPQIHFGPQGVEVLLLTKLHHTDPKNRSWNFVTDY